MAKAAFDKKMSEPERVEQEPACATQTKGLKKMI